MANMGWGNRDEDEDMPSDSAGVDGRRWDDDAMLGRGNDEELAVDSESGTSSDVSLSGVGSWVKRRLRGRLLTCGSRFPFASRGFGTCGDI